MGMKPIGAADKFRGRNSQAIGVRRNRQVNPKISIVFEEGMFNRLAKKAAMRGISFASIVREIVTEKLAG